MSVLRTSVLRIYHLFFSLLLYFFFLTFSSGDRVRTKQSRRGLGNNRALYGLVNLYISYNLNDYYIFFWCAYFVLFILHITIFLLTHSKNYTKVIWYYYNILWVRTFISPILFCILLILLLFLACLFSSLVLYINYFMCVLFHTIILFYVLYIRFLAK